MVRAVHMQDIVERVGTVLGGTHGNQRIGKMRAPKHGVLTVTRLGEHIVPGQRVVSGEPVRHPAGAAEPIIQQAFHLIPQLRVVGVVPVPQQVHALSALMPLLVPVAVAARELAAGQKIQPVLPRQLGGLRPPTCGVMVGQGESGKPSISNQRNQFGQRLGTIRNIGVNMQVVTFSHTLTVPHHSAPPVSVAHGLFGFRPTLKYAPRVG